jgi:nucleotide-binding universal stress UspA family protein
MYQKVLIPLDGSELAESALPHLRSLAKQGYIGNVILFSVATLNAPHRLGVNADSGSVRAAHINDLENYLDRVQSQLAAEGIQIESTIIVSVNPADTIAYYAQTNDVDLIIMATHGYTGVKRMFLGSVAFKVLREAHMPVLLVRA